MVLFSRCSLCERHVNDKKEFIDFRILAFFSGSDVYGKLSGFVKVFGVRAWFMFCLFLDQAIRSEARMSRHLGLLRWRDRIYLPNGYSLLKVFISRCRGVVV